MRIELEYFTIVFRLVIYIIRVGDKNSGPSLLTTPVLNSNEDSVRKAMMKKLLSLAMRNLGIIAFGYVSLQLA